MTFYIKTGSATFNKKLKDLFESRGYQYSRAFPVDIVFLTGEAAYYSNHQDLNKSRFVNVIYPRPAITYKEKLYRMFAKELFIPKIHNIRDLPDTFLKILKPIDGYAGEGITVVTNKQEIQNWVKTHEAPGWVIQDYVSDPNLKEGKKFHLRVHVVVIGSKVFMCKEIRYYLAKEKYVRSDWKNKDIHDTHYIEGQNEYLFPQDLPDDWESGSLTGIKHIVRTVFRGIHVRPDWNGQHAYYIFGIDVMFSLKKPILLEVNDRVGLSERSVETLIPGVLDLLQGIIPETFVKME
jgi:hypothetical protein